MSDSAMPSKPRRGASGWMWLAGGIVIVALLAAGGVAVAGIAAFTNRSRQTSAAPPTPGYQEGAHCGWFSGAPLLNPHSIDVGVPTSPFPNAGTQTLTMQTNLGTIEVQMDLAKAPCASAAMAYLATKGFFDRSRCHRMVTDGFKILQCGDPTGTGMGGPTFEYAAENLPVGQNPVYRRGQIAMANNGEPATTGSQFFLIDDDIPLYSKGAAGLTASYTLLGTVTTGMDILDKVIAGGTYLTDGTGHVYKSDPGTGAVWTAPKIAVTFISVTVGPVT